MLVDQKADGGLNTGTRGQLAGKSDEGLAVVANVRQKEAPKLADAGISKDLSSRAQKLAAVPEAEFEAEPAACGFSFVWRCARFLKSTYIRPYIPWKKKNPAIYLIAGNPLFIWCRRDESNTRPSHYE